MAQSVQMPQLGESVTEGTITRWLKQVGDHVDVDEPLVEVSTDKVDTEIPSPVAGVLEQILAAEDETVAVGGDLAVIGDGTGADGAGEPPQTAAAPAPAPAAADAPVAAEASAPPPPPAPPVAPPAPPEPAAPAPAAEPAPAGASRDVVMPALGESVTEGTITQWLVAAGDTVAVDQPILEVSTDKVDTEIPSPVGGVVTEIVAQVDDTVEVGGVLARIGDTAATQSPAGAAPAGAAPAAPPPAAAPAAPAPSSPAPAAAPAPPAPAPSPAPPPMSPTPPVPAPSNGAGGYVTPIVRRLAADLGVDLAAVQGTGVGGRIRRQDVEAVAEQARERARLEAEQRTAASTASASAPAAPAAPAALSPLRGTTEKMSRIRQTISRRMMESLHTSAQLTTVVEVDVTRIARLRQRAKASFEASEGVKLSFLPFFARAAVEALKAHPIVNASTDGASITYHDRENLGVAVDTERGLMVPVIRDAGDLNLAGLARRIADLAARTRDRKVGPDELSGSTFTLTNTGSRGALFDTPIINQPESAILGTGTVVKRPVVVADVDGAESIAIRSMVYLSLSYDHRIVDGADAARFLTTMKDRLEAAAFEGELGL